MAFPRRIPKNAKPMPMAPLRPEAKPFFATAEGRRVVIYLVALVAVGGVVYQTVQNRAAALAQTQSSTRPVEVKHPPTSFVTADTLHAMITAVDGMSRPSEPGVAAILNEFKMRKEGEVDARTGKKLGDPELVLMRSAEAVAEPAKFRGGYVRFRGIPTTAYTLGFDNPLAPKGVIYHGIVVEDPHSGVGGVMFGTVGKIPDFTPAEGMLEVEGVFLQTVTFETKSNREAERFRTVPYIVASSVKFFDASKIESPTASWGERLIIPAAIVAMIVLSIAIVFLIKRIQKADRPSGPSVGLPVTRR